MNPGTETLIRLSGRPLPRITADNAPYFEGCAVGELRIQRCADTGLFQFYPRPFSTHSGGEVEWEVVSGRGAVHTFTVIRANPAAAIFQPALPYVVAMIDIDEGVRLMGNIVGCTPDEVEIGASVFVEFHQVDDAGEIYLPFWRLVSPEQRP